MCLRRLAVLAVLLTAGCGTASASPAAHGRPRPMTTGPATTGATSAGPSRKLADGADRIGYPARGHGRWVEAPAQAGGPDGYAGTLLAYRVLVERDITGLSAATFADAVRATLAAPLGWTSGGRWRFHRSGPGQRYDFTIYLATPDTRDMLCGQGGDGYTSCRNGDSVVLNVARWVKGIPAYGGALAAYREYMVDHEVGHRLGQGHMLCPGPGRLAPVMQQQTLGLHGCRPNPWPYPDQGDGFYTGPSGQYDDPAPPPDPGN